MGAEGKFEIFIFEASHIPADQCNHRRKQSRGSISMGISPSKRGIASGGNGMEFKLLVSGGGKFEI